MSTLVTEKLPKQIQQMIIIGVSHILVYKDLMNQTDSHWAEFWQDGDNSPLLIIIIIIINFSSYNYNPPWFL